MSIVKKIHKTGVVSFSTKNALKENGRESDKSLERYDFCQSTPNLLVFIQSLTIKSRLTWKKVF